MLPNVIESYDLKKLQELTGFSRAQINRLVEKRFLTPEIVDKKPRFSYLDVSMINAIKSLYSLGVSKKQIHRNLELVRGRLEANKPLSTATFRVIDGRLIYDDGKYLYCLQTGRYLLDLEKTEPRSEKSVLNLKLTKELSFEDHDMTSSSSNVVNWYNLGVEKEGEEKLEDAIACYKNELVRNPQNFDAMINLGRLYQVFDDDLITARACYESVLLHEPEDNIANFNLGTIWDMLQEPKQAIACYEKAELIPDSYFNKGRILEQMGEEADAAEQFRIYHKMKAELDDDGDDPDDPDD